MGCCYSPPTMLFVNEEEKQANAEIEQDTNKLKKLDELKFKLLLLGAGESGKSTLLRQMRKVHGMEFGNEELLEIKPHLQQNVMESMKTLCMWSKILYDQGKMDTKVSDDNIELRDKISSIYDKGSFTEELHNEFKILLDDDGIKNTIKYKPQYQLIDTWEYLFSRMHLFYNDDFIPTFKDLIHCRQRTVGVQKLRFQLKNNKNNSISEVYEIFDVGGQKNERRKWFDFFDNTTAILYVAALSGYNQLLWEDQKNNRMRESIGIFRGIINMETFKDTHMILFLNKIDLFRERIKKYPVTDYFKTFKGDIYDENEIINYFKNKFLAQRQGNAKNKPIFVHITHATNTQSVETIFNCVRDVVVSTELENQGFL
mmetsp:Transcript_101356/g.124083  ORF Transcript_101356/g.124083 Transcript_101356/m.124083 type:complete len:371 (+) Transcript_101356:53-1165(+)